jgi:hypothetical protein
VNAVWQFMTEATDFLTGLTGLEKKTDFRQEEYQGSLAGLTAWISSV